MREWTVVAGVCLALMGCTAEAPENKIAEDVPVVMKAGQWTFTRQTTGYNTPTVTAQEYAEQLKNKSVKTVCVAVDEKGLPDADALAGDEGSECSYKDDAVMRKGRMIANLSCKKSGGGTAELMVEGNYKPDSLTVGVSMTRTVGGQPVLRTTHDLTGKFEGECRPEAQ